MGRELPGYLRGVAPCAGRLADLCDVDELVHDGDGRGVLTEIDQRELDAHVARATAEIREARRRWEMQRADVRFR